MEPIGRSGYNEESTVGVVGLLLLVWWELEIVCAEVLFTGSLERGEVGQDSIHSTTRVIGACVLATEGVRDEVLRLYDIHKDTNLVA